jgi:hypothetical protein
VITGTAGQRLRGVCAEVLPPSALEPDNQNFFIPLNLEVQFFSAAHAHDGAYRIANLAPGLYYALFGPCAASRYPLVWFKDQGAFGRASLISVSTSPVTAGINAVLPPGGTISGTLTGRAGRRLSGYCITAYDVAGQDWLTMLQATTHRGAYKITGLAPGRYKLLFGSCDLGAGGAYAAQWYPAAASQQAARAVLVRSGRDTTRVNATLRGGGSISGKVTDAATGKPDRYCGIVAALDRSGTFMAGAFINNDGRYRIGHLLAGRYTLQACVLTVVKTNVMVTGTRPTTGITIVLPRTGSMAGRVLDSTGTAPEAGVCVTAYPRTEPGYVAVAATGRNGRWTLTGMDPGSYRVLFSPVCMAGFPQVAPQWFNDKPSLRSATPVTVTAYHTTAAINARLAAPGGITGIVTDQAHAVVPGICVTALPQPSGQIPVTGVTAANGRFSIASLAPGRYLVRFDPGCGARGYQTQWYNSAASKTGAIPVTVTAGTTTPNINAAMRR